MLRLLFSRTGAEQEMEQVGFVLSSMTEHQIEFTLVVRTDRLLGELREVFTFQQGRETEVMEEYLEIIHSIPDGARSVSPLAEE